MNDITITISRGEYELLIKAKVKLELVTDILSKDDPNDYFMSNNVRNALGMILGTKKKPTEV